MIDDAQGMSKNALETALGDIAGDRADLAAGTPGRSLFGRGLSDVMRTHTRPEVQTYDGNQLSTARGEWRGASGGRWTIELDWNDNPTPRHFDHTLLSPACTGTTVRFIASNKAFHIPDPAYIISRLANFYMLRLIAADPGVELLLKQYRTGGLQKDRITYDFPVGQVIESFTRVFEPKGNFEPLKVDFLLARSERKLEGGAQGRDARENGLLIVDDLDAVYDLTFVDADYEKAEFLRHVYGVVRVRGLREILAAHLNSPDFPTSPLRVDREGFNREHPFSRALLDFLSEELRPCYLREKKRLEDSEQDKLSAETQRRIDDVLKHLNEYYQQVTGQAGAGEGAEDARPKPPKDEVSFLPQSTRLIVGQPRNVLLLVRDDIVTDGCELVPTATDGFVVRPESEIISRKTTHRWAPHPRFFAIQFEVTGSAIDARGQVTALVECADGQIRAPVLRIEDVLEEPVITPPGTMEFRPRNATGRPNRRNNLFLYVNPRVISPGHSVRFTIIKRTGAVAFVAASGGDVDHVEVRLDRERHQVRGQEVLRVPIPWRATAWNQRAQVEARVKVGPDPIIARAGIRVDEPDPNEGGLLQRVEYDELDNSVPSMLAAGVITVNMLDPLNKLVFGAGPTKEEARKEFDRRLRQDSQAQHRLAALLLEEISFRMLQQLYDDNKLHLPERREIGAIHDEVDRHKFKLALELYKLLVK